jgi:hypothetical protein
MKRYTAAQARQRFAEVLDAAENGQDVVIERPGVRFSVRTQSTKATRRRAPSPFFSYVDPAVLSGTWTWSWGRGGLRFAGKKGRR